MLDHMCPCTSIKTYLLKVKIKAQVHKVLAVGYFRSLFFKNTYEDICLESFEQLWHSGFHLLELIWFISLGQACGHSLSNSFIHHVRRRYITNNKVKVPYFAFAFLRLCISLQGKPQAFRECSLKASVLLTRLLLFAFPTYLILQNVESPCKCHLLSFSSPQKVESVS